MKAGNVSKEGLKAFPAASLGSRLNVSELWLNTKAGALGEVDQG